MEKFDQSSIIKITIVSKMLYTTVEAILEDGKLEKVIYKILRYAIGSFGDDYIRGLKVYRNSSFTKITADIRSTKYPNPFLSCFSFINLLR